MLHTQTVIHFTTDKAGLPSCFSRGTACKLPASKKHVVLFENASHSCPQSFFSFFFFFSICDLEEVPNKQMFQLAFDHILPVWAGLKCKDFPSFYSQKDRKA